MCTVSVDYIWWSDYTWLVFWKCHNQCALFQSIISKRRNSDLDFAWMDICGTSWFGYFCTFAVSSKKNNPPTAGRFLISSISNIQSKKKWGEAFCMKHCFLASNYMETWEWTIRAWIGMSILDQHNITEHYQTFVLLYRLHCTSYFMPAHVGNNMRCLVCIGFKFSTEHKF